MCKLFYQDVQTPFVAGNLVEVFFMVTLDACSRQGSRPDRKDKLVLSSGEADLVTYELCVDDGKYK